ncbi:MAG: hypothetical protein CMJ18_22245 [Phycisphaeraceae bacterium]|nr:hypothetical protein [Phycisphaeraceae bacterium]
MDAAQVLMIAGLLAIGMSARPASALTTESFSVDPASPVIDGNITPDDVLSPGPAVSQQGRDFGLQDDFFGGSFDNLNALSGGADPITRNLKFSVNRVAVGLPGSDVNAQAAPGVEEAQGDVYRNLPSAGSNQLAIDEQLLGLTPGFFGDDLDALELDDLRGSLTYFSTDFFSFAIDPGTILVSDGTGTGTFDVFANPQTMGLDPFDDLDALALSDVFEPGVLNPGIDLALFSLDTFSPSTFTGSGNTYMPGVTGSLSPADILVTDFTGSFSLWEPAANLGLRSDDELNALDTVAEAVPEPLTPVLAGIALLSLLGYQGRRRP